MGSTVVDRETQRRTTAILNNASRMDMDFTPIDYRNQISQLVQYRLARPDFFCRMLLMSVNLRPNSYSALVTGLLVAMLVTVSGCERTSEPAFVLNDETSQLDTNLRLQIRGALRTHCGTPQVPKMLGDASFDTKQLQHGMEVYMRRCAQCHGVSGDGRGPKAEHLYPLPRDYRRGIFKFTSTPYGAKPRREDLIHTLQRGIPGTSMPSFARLPKADLEAVVDYVIALSKRGELESQLVQEADPDEPEIDPEIVQELVDYIAESWKSAHFTEVMPLTPLPEFTAEDVAIGKELFTSPDVGCANCHGGDGRGQTAANVVTPLKDMWGHDARAADLTSGMLRGGSKPVDVYRRVFNGINGTPMPGFGTSAKIRDDPELVWKLVAYVMQISGQRRSGQVPPVGEFTFAPYPKGTTKSDVQIDEQ